MTDFRPPSRPMQNILVLSLKFLGDIVVATPAFRALRESFPEAKITVGLRSGLEEALEGNPSVDDVLSIPLHAFHDGSFPERLRARWNIIREIRRRKFDVVIALEAGDREAMFAWLSGARRRIGPDFQPFKFLYTDLLPIREDALNMIDYFCAMVERAGAHVGSKQTEMVVSDDAKSFAKNIIPNDDAHKRIVGLHPGARDENRRWPAARWGAVATKLIKRGDTRVVVITGQFELALADAIVAECANPEALIRADGLSIAQMAAVMQRCDVCVTCDSAPRHIAVAVGSRTVSMIPEKKMYMWALYDPARHATVVGKSNGTACLIESVPVGEIMAGILVQFP